jgi:phosphatidate phosphatase APP1
MNVIKFLVRNFPDRNFILIGDSGERDPEIYAKICRNYSKQIRGLFIRDLPQRPLLPPRWSKLKIEPFTGRFATFQSAQELNGLVGNLF